MKFLFFTILCVLMITATASAIMDAESMAEAKELSHSSGKPIFLEFMREDCSHCAKARREAHEIPEISQALSKSIHYMINVLDGEGIELKERYEIGDTYPVFILANSEGEVITRWTGYSGSQDFVRRFNNAMRDLTTISERVKDLEQEPTYTKAVFLARYFSETGDHPQAVDYFKQAQNLSPRNADKYLMDIFMNSANAVWKEQKEFDYVYPAADIVMNAAQVNLKDIFKVAIIISRLSRKFENTERLKSYLDRALNLSAGYTDAYTIEKRKLVYAEMALQLENDTAKAIELKESSMPANWQKNPRKLYEYTTWCLEHKVNLVKAEEVAQKVINFTDEGEMRARIYNTLSDIQKEQGKIQQAAQSMVKAIDNHPENPLYIEKLEELQAEMDKK